VSAKYCIVIYIPPSCAEDFLASSLSQVETIFKLRACEFEMSVLIFWVLFKLLTVGSRSVRTWRC